MHVRSLKIGIRLSDGSVFLAGVEIGLEKHSFRSCPSWFAYTSRVGASFLDALSLVVRMDSEIFEAAC
jgi:hypothetical protein